MTITRRTALAAAAFSQPFPKRRYRSGQRVRMREQGTDLVPLPSRFTCGKAAPLRVANPVPNVEGAWVHGAEPKLPGTSVYLCGYTPFDHTLTFEWS